MPACLRAEEAVLLFDKARLSYANESRAYYHVARALDVALPNTRSGDGEGKDGLS